MDGMMFLDDDMVGSDHFPVNSVAETEVVDNTDQRPWRLVPQDVDQGLSSSSDEDGTATAFVGDVTEPGDAKTRADATVKEAESTTNAKVPTTSDTVVLDPHSQSQCAGFAFVDDQDDDDCDDDNGSFATTDDISDVDVESQVTTHTNVSEKPDAKEVRKIAHDLLKRISEDNTPSVSSQIKSTHTAVSSTGQHVRHDIQEYEVPPSPQSRVGKSRKFWITIALLAMVVVGLVVAVVFIVASGNDGDNGNVFTEAPPNDSNLDDLDITIVATEAPTIPLELPAQVTSTSCQTIEASPNVQLWQAEDALTFIANATVDNKGSGYCGDGYATGFVSPGSRFVVGYIEVQESGVYFLSLRYSNADSVEHEILVSFDSVPLAFYKLQPTDDALTWSIETESGILLKEGSHYVEVWTRQQVASGNVGPSIDWVALQLHQSMSRSQYLLDILQDTAPSSFELQDLSWAQNASLAWMEKEDAVSWSTLSKQELIERFVLSQLFFATSGPYWTTNDGWLSSRHACDWFGIICRTAGNGIKQSKLVTDLILDGNALFGILPSDISLLKELVALNLDGNHMEGALFASLNAVLPPKLATLSLESNYLSGTIPFETFAAASSSATSPLKRLSLGNNRLSGPLSEGLYQLSNLETLSFPNNDLSGTLSNEIGSTLASLTTLDLRNNGLTGTIPASLGTLSLETLQLNGNSFDGPVPATLSSWSIQV